MAHQLALDFDILDEVEVDEIHKSMPFLFQTQVDDIKMAEKRFEDGGKGYLFTNGTGTGKTFVGLGIAKRFYQRDFRDILIVVPTEKKCLDWIEEGLKFKLNIYQLKNIKDAGIEITVTTYSNFYQNEAILKRDFHLVIYDESHYLNQSEGGKANVYYDKHKEVVNVPSAAKEKAKLLPVVWEQYSESGHRINKQIFKEVVTEIVSKTKVIFLSATPFAYHKSIRYADGCLFDIDETLEDTGDYRTYGYNQAFGWDSFMVSNFGYRMRYNRCTVPESGVDVNLLERNFFEKNKEAGIMSTRQLSLEYDYSRQFIIVNSHIGDKINKGLELFHEEKFSKRYPNLCWRVSRKYNYNYISQLLECIKAKEIHTRIEQHLLLGRKVVIFHNYNNSIVSHPFQFSIPELTEKDENVSNDLVKEIFKFQEEYSDLWNMDLSSIINTRSAIKESFPYAKEFNGTINKRVRSENLNEFNRDASSVNVIIVQVKAGQEGISLHDKTGTHQRVIINLGLPTAPTQAIQTEGRIYREGLKSNAIYEYVTLQTTIERIAFASKIAERSKTAENLAMGNLARDLETAFKEGYKNATTQEPSIEQGFGGKEEDKHLFSISEFEKAKTFYWQRGKKTASNKSQEGVDYFATPEPLGMKMVHWLGSSADDVLLEPSAGHGAIARWFPNNTSNHFVEPSYYLSSELAINTNGSIHNKRFEDYYIGNKFHGICMNPPFGVGGKTAMEHIDKACRHLNWFGGRIIAIIPNGESMNKRITQFFNDEKNRSYRLTGEIILPSITFARAGTSVNCKVVRIEDGRHMGNYSEYKRIDLSHITDTNDFFDAIEHLEF